MLCPMSYSITVVAKGGQLTLRHSGEVPDGEHVISGHEDATSRTLHVGRFTEDGKALARASSEHHREH